MTVSAVLFDLGDTLWHFPVQITGDLLHSRCAEQIGPLLAAWGVEADATDLSSRLLDAVEAETAAAAAGSLLSPDFAEVVDRVVRERGLSLGPAQLEQLWSAWHVDGARMGRQLYPDTVTTLEWARREGYLIGLITNGWYGCDVLQRELDRCHLGRAFDCITVSCDAGWLKPHPEIFYTALRGLGVEPPETVMVGDSPRTDIAGAKLLGMRAVLKRNGRRQPRDTEAAIPPDAMIDDLWELRRLPFLARGDDTVARAGALIRKDERLDW
jgi:HAD superfamily hydrolase (TIGR01549 family)